MKTKQLLFWHRRLGVLLSLILLLLASTGILLQHEHRLGLDRHGLSAAFWYSLLDVPTPSISGLPELQVFQVDQQLITPAGAIAKTQSALIGGLNGKHAQLVATTQRLWLLTPEGELIDNLLSPEPVAAIGWRQYQATQPAMRGISGQIYQLDFDLYEIQPVKSEALIATASVQSSAQLPPALAQYQSGISTSRLILQLHTGRLLGPIGEWLMSGFAICLLILSMTGLWLWGKRR